MDSKQEEFLAATPFLDCDTPSIIEKAEQLTRGRAALEDRAKSLFYYVRDQIKYDILLPKSLPEYFRASNTMARGRGYCVQKAVLLAALGRAAGIPTRLGFARLKNNLMPESLKRWMGTNILPFHGYTEFALDDRWVKATPAFDREMCLRNRIVPVDFDGRQDAMFHLHNQDGERHIEYIGNLGHYDDLPLDKLWQTLNQEIGPGYLDPPKKWERDWFNL